MLGPVLDEQVRGKYVRCLLTPLRLTYQQIHRLAQFQDVTGPACAVEERTDGTDQSSGRPRRQESKLDPVSLLPASLLQDLGVQPGNGCLTDLAEEPLYAGIARIGGHLG